MSVEAVNELPAWGVQKPPHGVGEKRFQGVISAAPAAMVKIPAGLKTKTGWGPGAQAASTVRFLNRPRLGGPGKQ
jgi:hypothetical protein